MKQQLSFVITITKERNLHTNPKRDIFHKLHFEQIPPKGKNKNLKDEITEAKYLNPKKPQHFWVEILWAKMKPPQGRTP